nr:PQQ-dependent sugar dehydrogenase [Microvirga flocculans]
MAIIGTPDADYIPGTDDADEIYGYDPDVGEGGLGIYALRLNTGLEQPTYVTSAPNDPYRLYVLEKTGLIKMMSRVTGDIESTPVLDLRGQIDTEGEQGLVGLAFHPQFGQNGNNKVYVTLSNLEGKTELREYSLTNGMIDPDSMRLVLRINEYTEQSSLHRGGWIGFGPDGYLYMTTGEGNQFAVAQDPNSLLGKVLRIDVDGADAYPDDDDKNFAIPDTNPTAFDGVNGTFAQSAVYAIGFRNPWRASFDSKGRMFIGDVGENEYEEINLLKAGANYGWGHHDANDDGPEDPAGPYTNPINHYYHGPGQNDGIGASVTGGYVYEGPIEALKGHYIFGDFMSGKLLSLHQDANGNWIRTDLTGLLTGGATGSLGMISSFGQDADGNIYAMDYATGSIYRLMPQVLDLGDTIEGGKGDDTIRGGGGDDSIDGGDDNDRLYGDAGADTLIGGSGNDLYYVDGHDTIVETANNGFDRVYTSESFALQADHSIEFLSTADQNGTTAINLTGNGFSQDLIGNAGANRLDGGGGEDTLRGLGGNDTYLVDGNDTIVEQEDGGIDTVEALVDNYSLGDHLENLTLRGNAVKGTGNALANILTGNALANILDGVGGADTLAGGLGNDTYMADANDSIVEQMILFWGSSGESDLARQCRERDRQCIGQHTHRQRIGQHPGRSGRRRHACRRPRQRHLYRRRRQRSHCRNIGSGHRNGCHERILRPWRRGRCRDPPSLRNERHRSDRQCAVEHPYREYRREPSLRRQRQRRAHRQLRQRQSDRRLGNGHADRRLRQGCVRV